MLHVVVNTSSIYHNKSLFQNVTNSQIVDSIFVNVKCKCNVNTVIKEKIEIIRQANIYIRISF